MKKLSLAYFGTPSFSARFLEKLINDPDLKKYIDVKLVVTQPDRPVGRKQILTESSVKTIAKKYNITVATGGARGRAPDSAQRSEHWREGNSRRNLLREIDVALVYAFDEIIPKSFLNLPTYGFWNIHPSLLPKYRGPSPIASPLIAGDHTTGVTIIQMDEQIDHGPIIAQEELAILAIDRRSDLEIRLTDLGFDMCKSVILNLFQDLNEMPKQVRHDKLNIKPQNHKFATYTHLLKKQDGFIPFSTLRKAIENQPLKFEELPEIIKNLKLKIGNSSKIVFNYFRGLYPWPGIWTLLPNGKRLKIIEIQFVRNRHACSLHIKHVQLEGKKEVDFETFNKAYSVF